MKLKETNTDEGIKDDDLYKQHLWYILFIIF